MMRQINRIIIHCSYTKLSMNVDENWITDLHVNEFGWSDNGYHKIILRNGSIRDGRPIGKPGAHTKGHNHDSIGICLIGGMSEDEKPEFNFTYKQMTSLGALVNSYKTVYGIPDNMVFGHNDFSEKVCPCFNVKEFFN